MNNKKDNTARRLAESHATVEPTITAIVRLRSENEDASDEPIKLLEVNTATVPTGVMPISFGASHSVPFPSVVVELTDAEFQEVQKDKLRLPNGWTIGETLFARRRRARRKA
jgi:hypothetical protein